MISFSLLEGFGRVLNRKKDVAKMQRFGSCASFEEWVISLVLLNLA